jgi:hypothetical protein
VRFARHVRDKRILPHICGAAPPNLARAFFAAVGCRIWFANIAGMLLLAMLVNLHGVLINVPVTTE